MVKTYADLISKRNTKIPEIDLSSKAIKKINCGAIQKKDR